MINIYVDGACKGNPGPGGFGVVILEDEYIQNFGGQPQKTDKKHIAYAYSEQCKQTTNNREELKAIIHAFELAQKTFPNETCIIHSDSSYSVNTCNNWIFNWARNNWKNSKKQTVENLDLMKILYNYLSMDFFNCQVVCVPGHQNILGNELADALATGNIVKFQKLMDKNNLSK